MDNRGLRTLIFVVAALVLGGAYLLQQRGGDDSPTPTTTTTATPTGTGGGTTSTAAPADAVVVSLAYSPEKEVLIAPALKAFNASGAKVDGHPVVAQGEVVSSGTALDRLRAGTLKPTLWSPSSSLWGRLLARQADTAWIPDQNPSLVRTPLVIAMWEPQARALGWPRKKLGWGEVLAEAQNPRGWAAHGHPEWGAFRLGHTNPDFSTSGLSAVAAEYYAATGKREGLTLADVQRPAVRRTIRAIESSIVHYGDTTLFFADQLAERGPAFASAVAMEEATLVDYNLNKRRPGGTRLVAIYPREGTFVSDNPLITLNAPWVTPAQKTAAQQVVDYLRTPAVQKEAGRVGFRPSSTGDPLGASLSAANGVTPAQPTALFSLPEPKVLGRVKALWHEDRKPADIALVVDVSGSMNDEGKIDQARVGLRSFLRQLSPRDRVSLRIFSDRPTQVTPLQPMTRANRTALEGRVSGLVADGGTAVYDALAEAGTFLHARGERDHIQAVVLLSDGQDTESNLKIDSLLQQLRQGQTGERETPRMFTIAYGADADLGVLNRIAEAAGGPRCATDQGQAKPCASFRSDPATIGQVYVSISSFF